MSPRNRVLSFGGAVLMIVAGSVVAVLVGGLTAEAVSLSLMSLGLIALISLALLEVGLSEDRARQREGDAAKAARKRPSPRRRRPN